MSERDTVTLGRVSGLHGVRGWIKVYSHTDPPPAIAEYTVWTLEQAQRQQQFTVSDHDPFHRSILLGKGNDDIRADAARFADGNG